MSKDLILPDYNKFHEKGPADLKHGKPDEILFHVQINRQTNMTGEQIAIQCPVFAHDSRAEMEERLQLAYMIVQERLENENKAMMALHAKAEQAKTDERNRQIEAQQKAKMEKMMKKGKLRLAPNGEVPSQNLGE